MSQEGLKRILNDEGFSLENTFPSCDALLEAPFDDPAGFESELLLLDISATNDIEGDIRALRAQEPKLRIVLLADAFDFETMVSVFSAGADGYIIKEIDYQPFLESLRLVALGEKVLPGALVQHLPDFGKLAGKPVTEDSEILRSLSDREIETLRCLIMGYPNKVIAYRLEISEATVKVHVKAILRKLAVQNRTQAAIWAVGNGVDPHVDLEPQKQGSAFAFGSSIGRAKATSQEHVLLEIA
nr:response regulator transcription factor [Aurantiacibacter rhizosphaerae]